MKINEKLVLESKSDDSLFISSIFTQLEKRRAGGPHLLRYQGLEVAEVRQHP
jgi:hypothetical protein